MLRHVPLLILLIFRPLAKSPYGREVNLRRGSTACGKFPQQLHHSVKRKETIDVYDFRSQRQPFVRAEL